MIRTRRARRRLAILLLAAGFVALLLFVPATTRQGVDYRVTTHQLPAYVKAIDFLQRHYQYKLLVSRICRGTLAPRDCVLALFDWTFHNIRPTPRGWPIIDDHPLHVAIRGYGESDQLADLFTVLSVYAGVPAFFRFVIDPQSRQQLVLSFARLDQRWVVFDVQRHLVFRDSAARLADVGDLMDDAALVDRQTVGIVNGTVPYSRFISHLALDPFVVPRTTRGQLQQPLARAAYELRRVSGLEHD